MEQDRRRLGGITADEQMKVDAYRKALETQEQPDEQQQMILDEIKWIETSPSIPPAMKQNYLNMRLLKHADRPHDVNTPGIIDPTLSGPEGYVNYDTTMQDRVKRAAGQAGKWSAGVADSVKQTAGRVGEAVDNTKKRVSDWLNAPTAAPTDPGELIAQQVKQPAMPGLVDANRARSGSNSATGADIATMIGQDAMGSLKRGGQAVADWVSPEPTTAATSTETDIQRKRKAADKLSQSKL